MKTEIAVHEMSFPRHVYLLIGAIVIALFLMAWSLRAATLPPEIVSDEQFNETM